MPVKRRKTSKTTHTPINKTRRTRILKPRISTKTTDIITVEQPSSLSSFYENIAKKNKMGKDSRLNLPSWLEEQINNNIFRGLKWLDRNKRTFVVPWKHASRQGWNEEEDPKLFKSWALYTGVYNEGNYL